MCARRGHNWVIKVSGSAQFMECYSCGAYSSCIDRTVPHVDNTPPGYAGCYDARRTVVVTRAGFKLVCQLTPDDSVEVADGSYRKLRSIVYSDERLVEADNYCGVFITPTHPIHQKYIADSCPPHKGEVRCCLMANIVLEPFDFNELDGCYIRLYDRELNHRVNASPVFHGHQSDTSCCFWCRCPEELGMKAPGYYRMSDIRRNAQDLVEGATFTPVLGLPQN